MTERGSAPDRGSDSYSDDKDRDSNNKVGSGGEKKWQGEGEEEKGRLVEKERGCTRRERRCVKLCVSGRGRGTGREASARSIRGWVEGGELLANTTLTAHSILEAVMQNNVSYPHEIKKAGCMQTRIMIDFIPVPAS
eukprot:2737403-Rhodomonas_salina.1